MSETSSARKTSPVYQRPRIYDLVFSYRDYGAEVDTLLAWYTRATGRRPASVLELAAGPAAHALAFAERGVAAAALDLAPEMVEYARRHAASRGLPLDVHCADMTAFQLGQPFDLAILMLNSATHLYTLDAFVAHLRAVAANVAPGGLYILEMEHPRDFVGRGPRPSAVAEPWTVEGDGLRIHVRWGSPDDPYDAIQQVFHARVELTIEDGAHRTQMVETFPMRDWTATEVEAALRLAGGFEVVARHGELALDTPFDNSDDSWRMVLVLRRV